MSNDLAAAVKQTNAAIHRRAFDEAEIPFREFLKREPDNADALRLMAQLLSSLNKHENALPFLERLSKIQPTTDTLLLLYSCQTELRRFADAEASLEAVLKLSVSPTVMVRLAKIKRINGKTDEGLKLVEAAHIGFPDNFPALLAYVNDLGSDNPSQALTVLETNFPKFTASTHQQIDLLRRMTELRACVAHRSNAPYGDAAATWEEVSCWPDPEGIERLEHAVAVQLQAETAKSETFRDLALTSLSKRDWQRADDYFQRARNPNTPHIVDVVSFGSDFYTSLEATTDDQIQSAFPKVEDLKSADGENAPIFFLPSDPAYFWQFTLPLMKQFSTASSSSRIHVHLLDGDAVAWKKCLEAASMVPCIVLSMSAEASGIAKRSKQVAKIYYHAVRFVRFYRYLKRHAIAGYALDVDAELHGNPKAFLETISRFDVALCGRAHHLEPWSKLAAGCVGISPTPEGLAFARMVAAYIAHWRNLGVHRWGVDQVALFGVYTHMVRTNRQPRTFFLPPDMISFNQRPFGMVNFIPGHEKFT